MKLKKSRKQVRPALAEQDTQSPAAPRSRLARRFAFSAVAIVLGLAAALIFAEVVSRLANIRPQRHRGPAWQVWHDGRYQDTTILGANVVPGQTLIKRLGPFVSQGVTMGEYLPDAKFRVLYDTNPRGYFDQDGGVTMQINALGLRGPEVTRLKPPGTVRILGLGDSFTFGVGVRDEHTYLRRVESALNEFARPGVKFEVLNAGTQGYNTRDEVVYLEQRWLELNPDLILITFYLNDAYSDAAFYNMGQGMGVYLSQPDGIARYSNVADLAQHVYRARQVRQEMQDYYAKQYFQHASDVLEKPGEMAVDWTVSRQALARAARLAESHRAKIAVVIFPELQQLDAGYPFQDIHRLVKKTCDSLSIPVLDLLDAFRGENASELWVHPSDHHPNEIAHRIAADAIEEFVVKQNLVSEPSPTATR